tara:strand:+ start:908 stop:1108 length:201 start_codon:yes stop_codon:yes gene_type:complete
MNKTLTLAMVRAATKAHVTDIEAGVAAQFLSDALTEATGTRVRVSYEQVGPRDFIVVIPVMGGGDA